MPKKTSTERIIEYVKRQGLATTDELQEKFDVSAPLISQITTGPGAYLSKTPRFIVSLRGKYQFWTTEFTRGGEVMKLLDMLSRLRQEYLLTQNPTYKNYSVLVARKLLALMFDIYIDTEMLLPPTTTVAKPEPDNDTKACDYLVASIKKSIKTGTPQVNYKAEEPSND